MEPGKRFAHNGACAKTCNLPNAELAVTPFITNTSKKKSKTFPSVRIR